MKILILIIMCSYLSAAEIDLSDVELSAKSAAALEKFEAILQKESEIYLKKVNAARAKCIKTMASDSKKQKDALAALRIKEQITLLEDVEPVDLFGDKIVSSKLIGTFYFGGDDMSTLCVNGRELGSTYVHDELASVKGELKVGDLVVLRYNNTGKAGGAVLVFSGDDGDYVMNHRRWFLISGVRKLKKVTTGDVKKGKSVDLNRACGSLKSSIFSETGVDAVCLAPVGGAQGVSVLATVITKGDITTR